MKTINEILLQVADELASEMGYTKTFEGDIYAKDDKFWWHQIKGALDPTLKLSAATYELEGYEAPESSRRKPSIRIDMHWLNPRLNIYSADNDFCCLTYHVDTGEFGDAQAAGADGIDMLVRVRDRINVLKQQCGL